MKRGCHSLVCLIAAASLALSLGGCSFPFQQEKAESTAQPQAVTKSVTGIVVENNANLSQIKVRELESDVISTLAYAPTSEIMSRYGSAREGDAIGVGEILQVTYNTDNAKIVSAAVPEDVWEYQDVKKFAFNKDENMLTAAGRKFQYTEQTFCGSDLGQIQAMELNNQDVLTVRGIGIRAYSVVRTQGHGYIRFTNYNDFMGGIAEVGDEGLMAQIGENMLITAPEGIHRVTLFKNGRAAAKTVEVASDRETIVDYKDYKEEAGNIGEVTFEIEPEGADLYLNGTQVDYSAPVTLNFGKYRVGVALSGYTSWTGILNVKSSSETISISLEEADSAVTNNATATPEATSTPASSDSSSDTITKKIDSKHTITVTAPEGAEVFVDNVYKGMAPCTFTKIIGSLTITLSDSGYETKSYSVDILDDGKNAKLSFADLVKADSDDGDSSESSATSTPGSTGD